MSGRGTAGGIKFQAEVGAYVSALLLAERPLSRLGGELIGIPKKIFFESVDAVDDVQINTDIGYIYFQAKRTINLSTKADGELASAVNQFVKQYRARVDENGITRNLIPAKDRLVLVVGDEAPATIANTLRDALKRNRTNAATGLPDNIASALRTFGELIENAWLTEDGSQISSFVKQEILSLCSVVVFSDAQRQIAEESLKDVINSIGEESVLVDLLKTWALDSSQNGTGGDETTIRLSLIGKIRLKEAPSFQKDVLLLKSFSFKNIDRLQRFTVLPTPEGDIGIERTVTKAIISAVADNSFAITGEPGAGKSAIIYKVASELSKCSPVVAIAVEANIISLDILRNEIGLEHPLLDVLKKLSIDKTCYFIIDALDSSRGGIAEATFKRLIEEVLNIPNWMVIASIRTFDLRQGKDWRRIFIGTPPSSEYSNRDFAAVRHFHVSSLTDSEKKDILLQSPALQTALASGSDKLRSLTDNPFNLALLGDLVRANITSTVLTSLHTRGDLLERYWEERIDDLGTPAIVGLRDITSLMINDRSIDLPITNIPFAVTQLVDELQRVGVLVTEPNRRIGFRHHILFDFAVARLLLIPEPRIALSLLSKENGAGLLVSPSLSYWYNNLKREMQPKDFWLFLLSVVGNETIDPIVRIETSRLAIETINKHENLDLIAEILTKDDCTTNKSFAHLVGSLLTKTLQKQFIDTETWAYLLAKIHTPKPDQLGSMCALISAFIDLNNSSEVSNSLGIASRNVFDVMSTNDSWIHWLASRVIPFVAKTYSTDIIASHIRLTKILEDERFAKFGYVEVPWLARETKSIAPFDPDLLVELFSKVFQGGTFKWDQVTYMSTSWILPLRSNAAQDFGLAEHSLAEDFPQLLEAYPFLGIRAMAASLKGEHLKQPYSNEEERQFKTLPLGEDNIEFEEDRSHFWAWDIDKSDHDYYAKIYRAFMDWVEKIGDEKILEKIPELALGETKIALIWRILFEVAAKYPAVIGIQLWHSFTNITALEALETRQSAINAIVATYPFLLPIDRAEAEIQWLKHDFSTYEDAESARRRILCTLFTSITEMYLATDAARCFLNENRKQTSNTYLNEKPIEFHHVTTEEDNEHWLVREGVDIKTKRNALLVKLSSKVKNLRDKCKENNSEKNVRELWKAVSALDNKIKNHPAAIEPLLDLEVSDTLAEGLGIVLVQELISENEQSEALNSLLKLTYHQHPQSNLNTEADFARHVHWGTPSPRIQAAHSLAMVAAVPKYWLVIKDRFETLLLADPHPAVRFRLLHAIPTIGLIDEQAMQTLIIKFAETETNPSNIQFFVNELLKPTTVIYQDLEIMVLKLAERIPVINRSNDLITDVVIWFAFDKYSVHSWKTMFSWIQNFTKEEGRLQRVLAKLRGKMALGLNNQDLGKHEVRNKVLEFIWSLISKLEPAVKSWPLTGRQPTSEEQAALKLFNDIANQIYYAVGYNQTEDRLATIQTKQNFLKEYSPMISKLTTLGTPGTVYHLLDVIKRFVSVDPEQCFDLISGAILRTTGVARYEYESMGATRFVELVSLYLADYRYIFSDNRRRKNLIESIAIFVEAGWPEARYLFQDLPNLLQ